MKYIYFAIIFLTFTLVQAEESEELKDLKKRLKHHEQQVKEIKKKIAEIESPMAAIDAEIKALEEQVKQIRTNREAKKKDIFQGLEDAKKKYKSFGKKFKAEKKRAKKRLDQKIKDFQKLKKRKITNPERQKYIIKMNKDLRKSKEKLEDLKAATDDEEYKDLWKEKIKPYYAKTKDLQAKINLLKAKRRKLKK